MTALLELKNVSRSFGGVRAIHNVSLTLEPGEIVGLIGPNGAGKSTLVNIITGVHPASSGEILHKGEPIQRLKPFQGFRRGSARPCAGFAGACRMNAGDDVDQRALAGAVGPIRPTICPGSSFSDTLRMACTPPNERLTFLSSRSAVMRDRLAPEVADVEGRQAGRQEQDQYHDQEAEHAGVELKEVAPDQFVERQEATAPMTGPNTVPMPPSSAITIGLIENSTS